MFSIFSILRNHATYERQRAAEIQRENLRWKLTIIFYTLIMIGILFGIKSAINAPDAMTICQQKGYSYATCFQELHR